MKTKYFSYLYWIPLCFIISSPILILFMSSFKTETQLFNDPLTFFFLPTIQNYEALLSSQRFASYFINSLITGCSATVISLLLGSMFAYGMTQFSFRHKKKVLVSTLLLRMIPPAILIVPIFYSWNFVGIADTRFGLTLIYIALNLPFVIWMLLGFFKSIPKSMTESAIIDGCNHWDIYSKIIIPFIRPGLAAAGIFVFRVCWNEFILALILTNRYTRTLPVQLSLFISEHDIAWGEIMAMGSIIAIPSIIIVAIAAKYIVNGLTTSGLKG